MAKNDAEDRKLCSRDPNKSPGELQWLVDESLERMDNITTGLAIEAAGTSHDPVQ